MSRWEEAFAGRTVLVTGHTGFKGSWLAIWLQELGAKVVGYSLPPPTNPSNFDASQLSQALTHIEGDVRDYPKLKGVIEEHQPDLIFHLAAQPIVLHGFDQPKETFDVNAGGTVNLLEAARTCAATKAMVMITTDKCYENQGWAWGYRENDPLGGLDPYSSSKSMAELAIDAYRRSFFRDRGVAIASVRAGNVIGGGDFSEHRLLPDSMRALMGGKPIPVRNPKSIRPWLHVLDPLRGYLMLAAGLLEEGEQYAGPWNFGPAEQRAVTAQQLVERAIATWGGGQWEPVNGVKAKPEMPLLRLNWDKAANALHWYPTYGWERAIDETVDWFKAFERHPSEMRQVCREQIEKYLSQTMG